MRPIFSALAICLVAGLCSTARADGGTPRVVVIETRPVDLPRLGPLALRATVVDAVESQDAEVIPFGDMGESRPDCVTPACLADISKKTTATHVLLIDATFAKSAYELQLSMWDAATNIVVSGDRQRCNVCVASDLMTAAHDQAVLLCTKRLRVQEPKVAAAATLPGTTNREGASSTSDVVGGATPPPRQTPGWRKAAAWVGIGAGVPVLGAGIALLVIDGRRACEGGEPQPCAHAYDTKTRGLALTVAGGALTAAGLVFLSVNVFGSEGEPMRVSVAPGQMSLSGRF